ncbi:phosphotransferase [Spirillospora sp. NPDC047279]|uniref:maltokinase N-terminal cap-like domain-containing protein n=1 Tax=Spirillospora sp. NPDC047279 TaxID=3155478 RepID=UPI0033E7F3F9
MTELIAGWLPRQRWFAGKDRAIGEVSVAAATELRSGDPAVHHLVLAVRQDEEVDHYQVLLGMRGHLPERLRTGEIGRLPGPDGPWLYDAAHDPEASRVLLEHIAADAVVGPLRFRRAPGATIDTGLEGLVGTAEQSNTSVVYGDQSICKLFRRLSPGVNPDLEVNLALSAAGSEHVPAVHGWIELDPAGPLSGGGSRAPAAAASSAEEWAEEGAEEGAEPTTLALLSEFLRTGTDGWQLAVTSVRDWFARTLPAGVTPDPGTAGGDFAAESERLGAATAAVHRDLASAFGEVPQTAAAVRAAAGDMHRQLAEVRRDVPDLAPFSAAIGAAFDDLAALGALPPFQRVHGDLHLGQAMRTDGGWVLLDFEGEPARSPGERRALSHPLRDVAGMLRSFEYAARFLLADAESLSPEGARELELRAHSWAKRNRTAFCRGYAEAGGADPVAHSAIVKAFELDKAVYEVRYEARNRPSWLHVPLRSLAHLAA